MPELPDVETFKRYLDATSLHTPIEGVDVESDILGEVSRRRLGGALRGHPLVKTRRHGKWLFAHVDDGPWLALHFGMTGWLSYAKGPAPDEEDDHVQLLLTFDDGYHLAYHCIRKLGTVDLVDEPDAFVRDEGLGPDALALDADAFGDVLGTRGGVKTALMRQETLAGIGNIYADEILFQARIHPRVALGDLDADDRRRLHRVLRRVLRRAIERGADPDRLPSSWLLPHREEGASCPRCGGRVDHIEVGGRSTYLCPRCQPQPH